MRRISSLVVQSVRRNKRDFLFSSLGIIIGIGTLLFFTALGQGVKRTVLERVFVVRQLEVVKKTYDSGLFQSGGLFERALNDDTVERLEALDGVKAVYPKMKLAFPSGVMGGKSLLGRDLRAELIADGIPSNLISPEEVAGTLAFKDWEAVSCQDDAACAEGFSCTEGVCAGVSCDATQVPNTTCTDPAYCDEDRCRMPIPMVISPQLLEIYNGSLHTALSGSNGAMSKLPKLSPKALVGLEGSAIFGKSFFLGARSDTQSTPRRVRLVGFSSKAIGLGGTMPIGYVKRLNALYSAGKVAGDYHSIVVETKSNEAIASVAQSVTKDMGFALSDKFKNAERASLLIVMMTLIFNLISVIILTVAAVNIMHTFLMLILERRRELGLMRALGATRGQLLLMLLLEAVALGLFGGLMGLGLGLGAIWGVDVLFATQVQDFPFKPDTLFDVQPWMLAMGLSAALLFCCLGALLPALRGSRVDPAQALTGR